MKALARITFTGVDDRTDLNALRAICDEEPRVEFAVLWSESRAGKENRYPEDPMGLVNVLPRYQRAVHLCGAIAQRFAKGLPFPDDDELVKLVFLDGRIQVNRPSYTTEELVSLAYTAKAFRTPIIVQARVPHMPWIPGLSVLHDCSGGTGKSPESWPEPEWVYERDDVAAYAGGHTPDNIGERLPLLSKARGNGLFAIDMESGVRTDDWFDLSKVCAVLESVRKWEASS